MKFDSGNNNNNAAVMVQYVRQRRIEITLLYGAKVLRMEGFQSDNLLLNQL